MTDDEAFVRRVVDSPGDDTPRLVYADWLEERGDPRGVFLRAEDEWAKPWRGSQRPEADPQLRDTTRDLEPVWVARVSRPPLGVCCEHVRFTDCGLGLSQADVNGLERRFGVGFPPAYRAFLLNYNAGRVAPPRERPAGDVESYPIVCFYPIGRSFMTAFETVPALDSLPAPNHLRGLIPLGTAHADLEVLFLGVTGELRGRVYSDDTVRSEWLSRGRPTNTETMTLPEYLGALRPTWGPRRRHQYGI